MLWPITTTRNAAGELKIGGLTLSSIAADFGTPVYIYDEETLRKRASTMRDAFKRAYPDSQVVYAAKAYGSPAVIRILRDEGLGLDVVSGGELYAGLMAGMPASLMTFHGNNKGRQELIEALDAGVAHIAVDNDFELTMLEELGAARGAAIPILLRINPGIDVHTHSKIATGVYDSKFGFPVWDGSAERAVQAASASPHLDLHGYHMHIGSQLLDWSGYELAIEKALDFAGDMQKAHGVVPSVFSPGGGFGISYTEATQEPDVDGWAVAVGRAMLRGCARHGLPLPHLVVEPGRSLVGPAGVALYEVGSRKDIADIRSYVSVDGGMADNIRPSLYDAIYTAEIANRSNDGKRELVTISGKYCESGDLLIKDIELPRLEPGDLLAVPGAGAYCLAMASNYNLAPRPAVVLVRDGTATLIRRRERYTDLLQNELVPDE
jgi:diaminopimelate decarboxylase